MSLRVLVLSNAITIIWALMEGWSVGIVMWAYWSQSVSIGILWFFKILCLKDFSTKRFTINDKPVGATAETKIQVAFIFLVHYGMFHFCYGGGLRSLYQSIKPATILPIVIVFFAYECFSFFHNRKWRDKSKPNIGKLMFFPYIRIFPMHLSFMAGGALIHYFGGTFSSPAMLTIFMLIKSAADVYMHAVERRGFADRR